jgi:hypothetical protein
MSRVRINVPASTKGPAALVHVTDDGRVYLDDGANDPGRFLGQISGDGSYAYSPPAAGHSGRIARYHTSVREWEALTPDEIGKPSYDQHPYRGGVFPAHYRKNTRKAALAYLLAVDAGADAPSYFTWVRS